MSLSKQMIRAVHWDSDTFGVPVWELLEYSEEALIQAESRRGLYTIKVDPLADKRLLDKHRFYYCDTLIEPICNRERLRNIRHPRAAVCKDFDHRAVLEICDGAFIHGRFHRDFNLKSKDADMRYVRWLSQLVELNQVYGLFWDKALAGFIGYEKNSLVLHAVSDAYKGKGYSKYWWSSVCSELMGNGCDEIKSSISASNLSVLNLYSSLGFSFGSPSDVYQWLNTENQGETANGIKHIID
jgi:hypothetical protein